MLHHSIMYLWFEAFPLVFERIYHFNLGENGLVYLCFLVAAVPTVRLRASYARYDQLNSPPKVAVYIWYQNHRLQPRMENDPNFRDEHRLEMGIPAGFFVPVSLLIFGWTSRESVHW